ncbi:MAG: hypothetical protein H5T86_11930 [Armatimonadetes bacterium]|nr:hypothetical protein [Armatimonadota bacterium]
MTKKERFLAAVRREVPDEVPCSPLFHFRYADKILGRRDWKAVFELHQRLGTVHFRGPIGIGWVCELPPGYGQRAETVSRPDGRVETRFWIDTPRGSLTWLHVHGVIPGDPATGKVVEPAVKTPDDWRIYADWLEQQASNGRPSTDQAAEAFSLMGADGVASACIGNTFGELGAARGMQDLIYDLYDCPDLLEACARPMMHMHAEQARAFAALPNEVAWIDICWATGAEVSLEHMERWALRDARTCIDLIHSSPNHYVGYYTLGRIRRYMPLLIDTGVDFVETFEPNQGDISLAEAKKLYGDKICIMGNFDCVILAYGTVEQAREEARRCLREGMEGGGYIMVTGDEVPADAKWENLEAMAEVCHEEGRYA